MLSPPVLVSNIDKAYLQFMQRPVIRQFVQNGGKVYAATEGQPREKIEQLILLGHRHFAEKYVQEAEHKYPGLLHKYPDLRLSYFGKLQTNKIGRVINLFHTVESISRLKEVEIIKGCLDKNLCNNREFFIQWNIGAETQKNGALTHEIPQLLQKATGKGLSINGLMIIPPKEDDPQPYFKAARTIADRFHLNKCQMGFSADFETAINCGATGIRISRLFFGRA